MQNRMCADPGDDKIPHGSWRKTYIFIYDNLFITRELNLLLVTVGNVWLGSSSLFCRSEKPRQFLNTVVGMAKKRSNRSPNGCAVRCGSLCCWPSFSLLFLSSGLRAISIYYLLCLFWCFIKLIDRFLPVAVAVAFLFLSVFFPLFYVFAGLSSGDEFW